MIHRDLVPGHTYAASYRTPAGSVAPRRVVVLDNRPWARLGPGEYMPIPRRLTAGERALVPCLEYRVDTGARLGGGTPVVVELPVEEEVHGDLAVVLVPVLVDAAALRRRVWPHPRDDLLLDVDPDSPSAQIGRVDDGYL